MRYCRLALALAVALNAQQPFLYNRDGGLDPLTVGMKNDQPIAIDWDEDGRTDILQRNLYSTTLDQPWWGIFFFKNIGTKANPRYAAAKRLTLNGQPIDDQYASYQTLDWNHDGHPDLLSGIGAGPRKGILQLYLNQGRRDPPRSSDSENRSRARLAQRRRRPCLWHEADRRRSLHLVYARAVFPHASPGAYSIPPSRHP